MRNIDSIIVVGVSFSEIDKIYFAKIKEVLPNAKWFLGYYSKRDRENAQKYSIELNLNAVIKLTSELLIKTSK